MVVRVVRVLEQSQATAEQLHDAVVVGAEDQFVRLHFRKSKPKPKTKGRAKTQLRGAEPGGEGAAEEEEWSRALEDEWMARTSPLLHVLAPIEAKEAADLVWQADEHLAVRNSKAKGARVKSKAKVSAKAEAKAKAEAVAAAPPVAVRPRRTR